MNIAKNTFVSLTYELHTDGHDGPMVEQCDVTRPLGFVFGAGRMLPAFEKGIENLTEGDTFKFELTPDEAYGPRFPEAIVDVPKNVFVGPDGRLREELLQLGSRVPMLDDEGRRVIGIVLSVSDDAVKLDFNNPLAGETLFFAGKIIEVRDATVDELLDNGHHGCGGGCHGGCGGGCHSGEGDGGCGGGCHGDGGCGSCGDDDDDDESGCGGCGCGR